MAVLTISREFRSGEQNIASAIAERMNYQYIDKEEITRGLRAIGEQRWAELVSEMDETTPSFFDYYRWEYRGFVFLEEAYIYECALKDKAIIVGRAGNCVLKDLPQVLRVRLSAPLESRIKRAMEVDGIDRNEARWLIEKVDRGRVGHIHANYHVDWYDLRLYDIVFNTAVVSCEQITEIVCALLADKEKNATPEAKDLLMGRALAARLKAKIHANPRVIAPTLDVFYDGENIVLRGTIHRIHDFERVEKFIHEMPPDKPVKNEINFRK
jgi:cytidylate kinase